MKTKTILFLFLLIYSSVLKAQVFSHASSLLGEQVILNGREYGSGVSFFDINKDGFDDITIPAINDSLLIFFSTGVGFNKVKSVFCDGDVKHAIWVDFDNDLDYDLFLSFKDAGNKLYQNNGWPNLVNVTTELGLDDIPVESYGSSWGDFDGDGWIDLFISNYNSGVSIGSKLFKNQAGLTFEDVSLSMGINVDSDFSLQSSFADFNNDGKLDIHVANDRHVNDALLINEGDYFLNTANYSGFTEYCEAMSSSVADFDHNGFWDIYVTNGVTCNFLYANQGNLNFNQIGAESGAGVFRSSWGATWLDWDNDSWEDLFVNNQPLPGDQLPFYYNSSGSFSNVEAVEDGPEPWYSFSSAKGDFNGDGKYDLVVIGQNGMKVQFFENIADAGNWIKIRLEGTVSNMDGVGAIIKTTIEGSTVMRQLFMGDSYLAQDSQWIILGIGQHDVLEQLEITWPSGQIDVYDNLEKNTTHTFKEGFIECPILTLENSEANQVEFSLCDGDVLTLSIPSHLNGTWHGGNSDGAEINISTSGEYFYTVVTEYGIINTSDTITVDIIESPEYELFIQNPTCFNLNDGSVVLELVSESWVFENGESDIIFSSLSDTTFAQIMHHPSGCNSEVIIELNPPDPLEFNFSVSNSLCFGDSSGVVNLIYDDEDLSAFIVNLSTEQIIEVADAYTNLTAGDYSLSLSNLQGCEVVSFFSIQQPEPLQLNVVSISDEALEFNLLASGGTMPYQFFIDGQIIENNYGVFLESSAQSIEVLDLNGCVVSVGILEFPKLPTLVSIDELASADMNKPLFHDGKIVNIPERAKHYTIYNSIGQVLGQGEIMDQKISGCFNSQIIFLELINKDGQSKLFKLFTQ
jgi:hypothetical protein